MHGIKSIIYQRNDVVFSIEVDKINKVTYMGISKKVDDEFVFNYLETFFRIIDDWQEEYIDTRIIDGDDWRLEIHYIDDEYQKYYGHAKFPINFEALERLNQKMIREVI